MFAAASSSSSSSSSSSAGGGGNNNNGLLGFGHGLHNHSSNNNHSNSSGGMMLSGISEANVAPIIEMHWKVPMTSVSGLAVASLQMTNERYKPYKGVRTIAKSGKFVIRVC
jgi:hypothetical protein